jgi:isopentenyldiphosphate isomerase
MINDQELIFAVDENNNPVAPVPRKGIHENRIWHRVTHVWVMNLQKDILVQKRSLAKDLSPGMWEPFFGGHLGPNDNDLDCAAKEVEEEIGLMPEPAELRYFKTHKCEEVVEFEAVFIYKWDGSAEQVHFEKEEIDEIKWVPLEEVKQQILAKSPDWVVRGYEIELFGWLEENLA